MLIDELPSDEALLLPLLEPGSAERLGLAASMVYGGPLPAVQAQVLGEDNGTALTLQRAGSGPQPHDLAQGPEPERWLASGSANTSTDPNSQNNTVFTDLPRSELSVTHSYGGSIPQSQLSPLPSAQVARPPGPPSTHASNAPEHRRKRVWKPAEKEIILVFLVGHEAPDHRPDMALGTQQTVHKGQEVPPEWFEVRHDSLLLRLLMVGYLSLEAVSVIVMFRRS